jgi:hypothetical protein
MRVALQGYRIWYLDALRMQHWMEPRRLTHAYRESLLNGVTRPREVMGTYYRMLRYAELSGIKKKLFVAWQFIKHFSGSKSMQKFTQDYCFFASAQSRYSNDYNRIVKEFYDFLQKNKYA